MTTIQRRFPFRSPSVDAPPLAEVAKAVDPIRRQTRWNQVARYAWCCPSDM